MHVFLIWQLKNQQTDENAGYFLNMRSAGQGVKMLCKNAKTQSETGGHPRHNKIPHQMRRDTTGSLNLTAIQKCEAHCTPNKMNNFII